MFAPVCGRLNLRLQNSLRRTMEEIEAGKVAEAREEYSGLKEQLNELWRSGQFQDCAEVLDDCVGLNSKCDTLRRYRARARHKVGDRTHTAWADTLLTTAAIALDGASYARSTEAPTDRTTPLIVTPLPPAAAGGDGHRGSQGRGGGGGAGAPR